MLGACDLSLALQVRLDVSSPLFERERGKVLLWVAGGGRGRRGRHSLALFAASASVLEGPQAVGALGDWPFSSSAVVSHHGHPNRELYHHDLALDCSRDG